MAFAPFPNQQYFRDIDTNGTIKGGYFNLDDGIDLKHIMITIFIRGVLAGSEQLRMRIFGNNTTTVPIVSSNWASLSGIGTYANNWIGNIYMDFDGQPLNPNINYYMSVQAQNYTRNLDAFYIGVNLDWYAPVNTQLSVADAGFRVRILGDR